MEDAYGVVPLTQHYACVVNLLVHAGRLGEAVEFINKTPTELNEMIWQTLFGACRIHGNTELGYTTTQKILSTQPEHSSTYVLFVQHYGMHGYLKMELV
ncbi:pentatricopeptide repeat-containing protein [Trifolium pratense]|uniref:Pentatricopeptide repeat-containing protein n=1 Tax=Trifolium pratense TaxID=57577 RepID=A0A2K3MT02_TRIPR|nr:pentatricopeptide repeat-containing protein [Trifolium pratense]